jgi:hypothetical protein
LKTLDLCIDGERPNHDRQWAKSGDDPLDRGAGPGPLHEAGFDAGHLAGGEAAAPVENLALVPDDGVEKPSPPDVLGQFPQFGLARHGEGKAGGWKATFGDVFMARR